jgi:ubiquinone/menaquinone biosynthesis C-methylase UbiE
MSQGNNVSPFINFITTIYDPGTRLIGVGKPFMQRILRIGGLQPECKVLDIGCGTGTLILEAKKLYPDLDITGLDADTGFLQKAKRKLEKAGIQASLVQGLAQDLPFQSTTFDLVTSSLVFHHIPLEDKKRAMKEVFRVLKPGAKFVLVDFGKPENTGMRILLNITRLVDGQENMKPNLDGKLPVFLQEVCFEVEEVKPRYLGLQFLLARKLS